MEKIGGGRHKGTTYSAKIEEYRRNGLDSPGTWALKRVFFPFLS